VTPGPLKRPAASSPSSPSGAQRVVMLLDNHYGPDPRVAFERELLERDGVPTRILAWDRRSGGEVPDPEIAGTDVVRIAVPAPSGGGWRSFVAVVQFGIRVWRGRRGLLEGASLLIVHDVYLLPLGWLLAHHLRLPFVYDAHEEWARMEADRYPKWALRLVTTVESRLARSAFAVAVPGASRTARWDGILNKPPIVLPNLVRSDRPEAGVGGDDWDLLYVGTVSEGRRPDLLVELARLRPDLRVGVAGRGRSVGYVARAAEELPNLSYLGWRSDADELLARTTAIYYGLDPEHPYSDVACPNTLYQALLHRKPLIFFCGGEPAQLANQFKIGIRCEASVHALSAAVDHISAAGDWEFDEALRTVWERAETDQFVTTVKAAARQRD
jgi:glycosyltransferase involved in cell wall biosynthesis